MTIRFLFAAIFIYLQLPVLSAQAMEFDILPEKGPEINGHRFPDRKVIYAHGSIKEGDAEKLLTALRLGERDEYGNIRIYLKSGGGSVSEALKMVEYMDMFEVSAFVKDGDMCASACASILFVSARVHFLDPGGQLGFHSCTVGNVHPSAVCNKAIAQNATYHGTGFGAVETMLSAQSEQSQNNDMIYLDHEVACFVGLCGPPVYDPVLAIPSFDCSKSQTLTEKYICSDAQIARYDASLERIYTALLDILPEQDIQPIITSQQDWIKKRNACGDQWSCVLGHYALRRDFLRSSYVQQLLIQTYDKIPDSAQSKTHMQKISMMMLSSAHCEDINACDHPPLADHTYEFFVYNAALRNALTYQRHTELAIDGMYAEGDYGTLDCVLAALCDPAIKTVNIMKGMQDVQETD